jgi:hypothetical protein
MTTAVRDLIRSFQLLSDAEKREATNFLLRQVVQDEASDLGTEPFAAIAEELFLDLDAEEAGNGEGLIASKDVSV